MVERRSKRFMTSGRKLGRQTSFEPGQERVRVRRRPANPVPFAPRTQGLEVGKEASLDRYAGRDFSGLIRIQGFSERLLRNHIELYQGYVKGANKLLDELEAHARAETLDRPAFQELKRRFGWEYNGVRLHELYFENLTKTPVPLDVGSNLHARLTKDFGNADTWAKEFRAVGAMRGIGWVVLYYDTLRHRLFNAWVDQHDTGHLVGGVPVLVMDVFEHAYVFDYGIKKGDCIEAFFGCIHWEAAIRRLP